MTHSEAFLAAKYGTLHPAFTNDYLLKHGSFFMKPTLHADGFVYPAISEAARYQFYKDMKCEKPDPDLPLNFAIKQEKPPTPPTSTSPSPLKSPSPSDARASPQILNGQSKSATWIFGKQKLSWDNSTVASYNPDTKMFRCIECNAVGFLSRIAEHYLGTHTSAKVFQCLHCPYSSTWSRCVRMHMAKYHGVPNAPPSLWKGQPLLEEIFQLLTNLKTTVDSQGRARIDPELCDKKFICPKCPYTTDRRDLYLRHENIHKEDKPYHCYICFKLFNRADHVKKHFLRIHRGHPYDISLVRRRPPRVQSSAANTNTNGNSHTAKPVPNNFSVDKLISKDDEVETKNGAIDLSVRDSSPSDSSGKLLKTFQCPCCEWEGVDSWCLRRHMNVHMKNFECPMCEFKVVKAERLFTHVYRAHKKLICTKCKFLTELAHEFEIHVKKECNLEIVVAKAFEKLAEESPNDSDDASPDMKYDSNGVGEITTTTPYVLPDKGKFYDHQMPLDLKGSVSLMPLHNSISYCYPGAQGFKPDSMNGDLHGYASLMPEVMMNGDSKNGSDNQCKMDVKPELASPVQSSSDSGIADLTSDNNDQDLACWQCGCEFANLSSLKTHSELYHRDAEPQHEPRKPPSEQRVKKFSCAICNFNSDKQRTILEHMRFHTGEVLYCRAGPPCAFTTVCDSTLEQHIESEHSDGLKRCPHCGFPCTEKVPFIRHYRKCHHSKSCSRCRAIKRSLDPKVADNQLELPLLLESCKFDRVQPYLHHNPYSKKINSISPYTYSNAAMSKVAVAIEPLLQRTATEMVEQPPELRGERKSRKQTAPRKLLNANKCSKGDSQRRNKICDKNMSIRKTRKIRSKSSIRKKLLKFPRVPSTLSIARSFRFKNNANFARHLYWRHQYRKYLCTQCSDRFRHEYQVMLHVRKEHENVLQ